jgi:hypothetical protein
MIYQRLLSPAQPSAPIGGHRFFLSIRRVCVTNGYPTMTEVTYEDLQAAIADLKQRLAQSIRHLQHTRQATTQA